MFTSGEKVPFTKQFSWAITVDCHLVCLLHRSDGSCRLCGELFVDWTSHRCQQSSTRQYLWSLKTEHVWLFWCPSWTIPLFLLSSKRLEVHVDSADICFWKFFLYSQVSLYKHTRCIVFHIASKSAFHNIPGIRKSVSFMALRKHHSEEARTNLQRLVFVRIQSATGLLCLLASPDIHPWARETWLNVSVSKKKIPLRSQQGAV